LFSRDTTPPCLLTSNPKDIQLSYHPETVKTKFITADNAVPHLIAGLHNTVHLEALLLAVEQNNPNMERA